MVNPYQQEFLQVVQYLADHRDKIGCSDHCFYQVSDILDELGMSDDNSDLEAIIMTELAQRGIIEYDEQNSDYISLNDLGLRVWKMYCCYHENLEQELSIVNSMKR